jgi:hypothetical protein
LAICATLGTAVGFHVDGSQASDRRNALAQWKNLFDVDLQREDRPLALDGHRVEVVGVGEDPGRSVDAQRVPAAGNEEQRADIRPLQHVEVAVHSLVARPLRNRDRGVVDDVDEARRVALR